MVQNVSSLTVKVNQSLSPAGLKLAVRLDSRSQSLLAPRLAAAPLLLLGS